MVENHYEIIVILNGEFLFSTSNRSLPITNKKKVENMVSLFREKFPVEEGYSIRIYQITCYGEQII